MRNTNKKGFTIVELVVVVAVIAILAAVLIPTVSGIIKKANIASDTTVAKNMNTALAEYSAENGDPEDFEEVLVAIEKAGYVLANLNAKANGNLYAWDKANNQIVYIDEAGEVIYQNVDFVKADLKFVVANTGVKIPDWADSSAVVDMTKPTGENFLKDALVAGGTVTLGGNITTTDGSAAGGNYITADTTVNFGNNVITLDVEGNPASYNGLRINGGTVVLNANENGGVVTSNNPELYAITIGQGIQAQYKDVNVTINGGKYYAGGATAINVVNGTVTINGGFFECNGEVMADGAHAGQVKYLINMNDTSRKAGTASVVITGGTFVNFNPANNVAEGAGTNFVADGYKVDSETQANGDIWYTVVAE